MGEAPRAGDYVRSPRQDPTLKRFAEATSFEPGHQQVVLARHGRFTTECVYDRTTGAFSSLPGGHLVGDVETWEPGDRVPGTASVAWRQLLERYIHLAPREMV